MKTQMWSAALSRGTREKDPDVSPLIDMVFILLIFFIVTTVFVDEAGFKVEVPGPPPPNQPLGESDAVRLSISANGAITCGLETLDLSAVPNLVRGHPDAPVHVEVAKGALSGWMVQVLDAARVGGAENISVARMR